MSKSKPTWKPGKGGRVPFASAIDGNPYAPVGSRPHGRPDALDKVQRPLPVSDADGVAPAYTRDAKMAHVAFGQDYDERRTERHALTIAKALDTLRAQAVARDTADLDLSPYQEAAIETAKAELKSIAKERAPNPAYNPFEEGSADEVSLPDPTGAYGPMLQHMVAAGGSPTALDGEPLKHLRNRIANKEAATEWHERMKDAAQRAMNGKLDPKEALALGMEYASMLEQSDEETKQNNEEKDHQKAEADEQAELERALDEMKDARRVEEQVAKAGTDVERKAAEHVKGIEQEAREQRRMSEEEAARKGEKPRPSFDDANWGTMEVVNYPLSKPQRGKMKLRSPKFYRRDAGAVIRYAHRHAIDRNVFGEKQRKNPRAVILLDASGSMSVPMESVLRIMELSPGATVAAYHGAHDNGWLRILAHKGKCVDESHLGDLREGGGNIVDGPALRWLAKQNAMKLWVCDGIVTGIGDSHNPKCIFDAFDVVRRNRIRHVLTLNDCIELLESGRLMDGDKVTGRKREIISSVSK